MIRDIKAKHGYTHAKPQTETAVALSDTSVASSALGGGGSTTTKLEYVLPDNKTIGVNSALLGRASELLWHPSLLPHDCTLDPAFISPPNHPSHNTLGELKVDSTDTETTSRNSKCKGGIHQMVYDSIMHCDPSHHALLLNNIVCSGGNTLINGFDVRLERELKQLINERAGSGSTITASLMKDQVNKLRIIAPADRINSAWIGGIRI
jgi:actin-related protein